MKKKAFLSIIILFLLNEHLRGQNKQCYTDNYVQALDSVHSGFEDSVSQEFFSAMNLIPLHDSGEIFNIQVVVHVVYNKDEENIPDSLIHSQIKTLNDCFRRQHADTINTLDVFKDVASDSRIQFSLATKDPKGNPTTGITRTKTSRRHFMNAMDRTKIDRVKSDSTGGKDSWSTAEYLNIWVCNLDNKIIPLLGYAYPPIGSIARKESGINGSKEYDGVVISYRVFGEDNPQAGNTSDSSSYLPFNEGKTAVHEIGHYLGLRHIWGFNKSSCESDDGLKDTPNTSMSSDGGCNTEQLTCRDSLSGIPDMVQNYMDNACDSCSNLFTKDQASLMRQILRTTRAGLHHSYNANNPSANTDQLGKFKHRKRKNRYKIKTKDKKIKIQEVKVVSRFGEDVKDIPSDQNDRSHKLRFNEQKEGTYYLLIKINDQLITQKLVI